MGNLTASKKGGHDKTRWNSLKRPSGSLLDQRQGGADDILDLIIRRSSMYSYEESMKAIELYIKFDRSIADTIRELGYPSRGALARWYKEYQKNGCLRRSYERKNH